MYILGMLVGLVVGAIPIVLAIKTYNAVENYFLRRKIDKFFFHDLPQTEAGRALLKQLIDEKNNQR